MKSITRDIPKNTSKVRTLIYRQHDITEKKNDQNPQIQKLFALVAFHIGVAGRKFKETAPLL